MNPRILIFAIEGMNRAGKGTQLQLLQKYIEHSFRVPTFVLRGDGRRYKEEGEIHYRIERKYHCNKNTTKKVWDTINNIILKTKEKNQDFLWDRVWDLSASQLQQEALFFIKEQLPVILDKEKQQNTIILFDRSVISIYYREIQTRNKKIENTYNETLVKPDHYFVLDVSKNELIKRSTNDDNSAKAAFRKEMIMKNFGFFEKSIEDAQSFFDKNQITILNGEQEVEDVHKNIKKIVNKYIYNFLNSNNTHHLHNDRF